MTTTDPTPMTIEGGFRLQSPSGTSDRSGDPSSETLGYERSLR